LASESVLDKLAEAFLRITSRAASTRDMRIVRDEDVIAYLLGKGCPDRARVFETPSCSKQLAVEGLGIGAEVAPTFRSTADDLRHAIELRLTILDAEGRRGAQDRSRTDANYDALAEWAAREVAQFLAIDEEQIRLSLESSQKKIADLDNTLDDDERHAPSSETGPRVLQWLVSSAWAQPPQGTSAEGIQRLLRDLEAALSTRNVEEVSQLYLAMTPTQREALQRYFNNFADLQVHVSDPEITPAGDTAQAAFVREDMFTDKDGERSNLTVRLVADLVRSNGTWKIRTLHKPS
jgi:hypothetical protein